MKKVAHLSLGFVLLSLAFCKSTQTGSKVVTPEAGFVPADNQMAIVEKHWPGSSKQEVAEGQAIFMTKCTRCHIAFEITSFSEKKWQREIDKMSPKASLTPEEKLKLTKHILSYREANTAGQDH